MFRQSLVMSVFVVLAAPTTAQTPAPLTGTWEGQLLLNSNWRFMEVDFGPSGNLTDAKVDTPQERRKLAEFSIDGPSVRWTLVRGQAGIRFEGTRTLDNDTIRGHPRGRRCRRTSKRELAAVRSVVGQSRQSPGSLSPRRSLSARRHCRSGSRVPASQPRLPFIAGRLDPSAVSMMGQRGGGYPFHSHSSAAGNVCSLTPRSQCAAFRANTNW